MKPLATYTATLMALPRSAVALRGRLGRVSGAISWQKLIVAALRGLLPSGWVIVPEEMTNEMHRACKAALYDHLKTMRGFHPTHRPKQIPGESCPRVDGRTKRSVRWKAIIEAADGRRT